MRIAASEAAWQGAELAELADLRTAGLTGLEVGLPAWQVERHALFQAESSSGLLPRIAEAGLSLASIYLGCFLEQPFGGSEGSLERQFLLLDRIAGTIAPFPHVDLVMPLLGKSEPRDSRSEDRLAVALARWLGGADFAGRMLLLAPWSVDRLQKLVATCQDPRVGIAYDIGLATSLGFDPIADLRWLGPEVRQLRLRDVDARGESVPLSHGRAEAPAVLQLARDRDFSGWFVVAGRNAPGRRDALRVDIARVHELLGAR